MKFQGAPLSEREAKVQAINSALGTSAQSVDRFMAVFARARNGIGAAGHASRQGPAWDAMFGDVIEQLDAVDAQVRSGVEVARRLAAELAAELKAEEDARAAAEAEEGRRKALEAAVRRGVEAEETRRLTAIEEQVREQLATTTGGAR